MNATSHDPRNRNCEELSVVAEQESERLSPWVEIRHTDHGSYREELRRRLTLVESFAEWGRRHSPVL